MIADAKGTKRQNSADAMKVCDNSKERIQRKADDNIKSSDYSKTSDMFVALSIFAIIGITSILTISASPANAAEANSTDYKIISQVFDMGGGSASGDENLSSMETYLLTTSMTDMTGISQMKNTLACIGYLCFSLEQIREQNFITFVLNLNISGKPGDVATAGGRGPGFYMPVDLNKYFTCASDPGIAGNPTFGLVFSGRQMNYLWYQNTTNTSEFRLSQFEEGNQLLLPVTFGGCNVIEGRMPITSLRPFVSAGLLTDAIELFLSYPFTDIVGSFQRSGPMTITMEKNNTNQIVFGVV